MYAQEWLATAPFPFHIDGGPELRAAMTDLAARCTAALTDEQHHFAVSNLGTSRTTWRSRSEPNAAPP